MGTLNINLPGSSAREAVQYSRYVTFYKITVFSKKTGKVVVPTKKVNGTAISEQIPVGSNYTVIIQGINDGTTSPEDASEEEMEMFRFMYEHNLPLFLGRTDNVSIKEGEATPVSVHMVYPFVEGISNFLENNENPNVLSLQNQSFDWGTGKFPTVTMDGETSTGWAYEDINGWHSLTELPDTSTFAPGNLTIIALFGDEGGEEVNREPRQFETGDNVFFATQNGIEGGDGKSKDRPMKISSAISALTENSILYLLEDVNLGQNPSISKSVTIIGAGGSNGWGKVTVTSSGTYVIKFTQANTNYEVQNVVVYGNNERAGISPNGTLTLDSCDIRNCNNNSSSYGGGGIEVTSSYTSVTLRGCTIENCSATKDGGGIYSAGTLTLYATTISGCQSAENGGGIATGMNASVTLTDSAIKNCTANYGGGLYLNQPKNNGVSLINSTITGCSAENPSDNKSNSIYVSTSSGVKTITQEVSNTDTVSSLGINS